MDKDDEKKSWVEKFFDNNEMFGGFSNFRGRGGYSVRVTQTSEGTTVKASLSDQMDREKIRKELEMKYPNAKIEIKGGKKSKKQFKVKERKKISKKKPSHKEANSKKEKEEKKNTEGVSLSWEGGELKIKRKNEKS